MERAQLGVTGGSNTARIGRGATVEKRQREGKEKKGDDKRPCWEEALNVGDE